MTLIVHPYLPKNGSIIRLNKRLYNKLLLCFFTVSFSACAKVRNAIHTTRRRKSCSTKPWVLFWEKNQVKLNKTCLFELTFFLFSKGYRILKSYDCTRVVLFQGYFDPLFTPIKRKIDSQIDEKGVAESPKRVAISKKISANHLLHVNSIPDTTTEKIIVKPKANME